MAADPGPGVPGESGAEALLAGAEAATVGVARFFVSLAPPSAWLPSGAAAGDASGVGAWTVAAGSAGRAGASTDGEGAGAARRPRAETGAGETSGGTPLLAGASRYRATPAAAASTTTPMTTSGASLPFRATGGGSAAGAGLVTTPEPRIRTDLAAARGGAIPGRRRLRRRDPTEMIWPQLLHGILKAQALDPVVRQVGPAAVAAGESHPGILHRKPGPRIVGRPPRPTPATRERLLRSIAVPCRDAPKVTEFSVR